jgi:hypothetical protein
MRAISSFVVFLIFSTCADAFAQGRATWIWYPGDYEIWLSNQMQVKRNERDALFMPFWRLYGPQPLVDFSRDIDLQTPEPITITAEGKHSVTIDGRFVQGDQQHITLPAGKHRLDIEVYNSSSPPALYVAGRTVRSDASWAVASTPNPQLPGRAPHAGSWNFDSADQLPSAFKLPTREVPAVSIKRGAHSILVDFGEETIGFVKLRNLKGKGKVALYYGESLEEALAPTTCETFDKYTVDSKGDFVADHSRALRYVNIQFDEGMSADDVSLLYEYLPLADRGSFTSSDPELNKIWQVARRTLELNTREFFIDGIKRDHWVWSGDAVQAYRMNYYAFFDEAAVRRTTWALRGGDPVDMHINTILDYSLYWFIGVHDYYQYTGDAQFVKTIYPRMVSLMDFVLGRRDKDGMLEGMRGDWVFVDWAKMPKDGQLSTIQMLFARSLDVMADCADIANDETRAHTYRALAAELKQKIASTFWDGQRHAYISSRKDGRINNLVTRHPNIFALLFGYANPADAQAIKHDVLMNDAVPKITTPYMRFYELSALAQMGEQTYVTSQIKDYWGGMLKAGATCFWEQYDPKVKGAARYAMYGKAFGMSLCHAWGASPLYLLGRYYLGVYPTKPGYTEYAVEPNLGGLKWIDGKVPTPNGDIAVHADEKQIRISTAGGNGVLRFSSSRAPISKDGPIRDLGNGRYEMTLAAGKQYTVSYAALTSNGAHASGD